MEFAGRMSDPVWGAIPLTALELELLKSRTISRLGQIKQLGLAFLDFPSLSHTRLEHSVGVMHVADRLFTSVESSPRTRQARRSVDRRRQAVRLAALLHDLGHPPFSHAVELTFQKYRDLLERAKSAQPRNMPGGTRRLSKHDLETLFDDYSHEAFTYWLVSRLVAGRVDEPNVGQLITGTVGRKLAHEIPRLCEGKASGPLAPYNAIISGDFDADRIDYLIRDNQHSGFAVGLALEDLQHSVHWREHAGRRELFIDSSALPFVNAVLAARHRLIRRVHLAPAGRTGTQMMASCLYTLFSAYEPEKLASTIVWLHTKCTDYTFFSRLLDEAKAPKRRWTTTPKRHRRNRSLRRAFVDGFVTLARDPRAENVWDEIVKLSFIEMHPALRLLAYLVSANKDLRPASLVFRRGGRAAFMEVSAKPSRGTDLLVDYGHDEHASGAVDGRRPRTARIGSLDYFGSTENRMGRAILLEAMSNVDVFAYEVRGAKMRRVRMGEWGRLDAPVETYWSHLSGEKANLAKALYVLARRGRRTGGPQMVAAEYLLLLLYTLDKQLREMVPTAHGIYVYRARYLINEFIPSLPRGGARRDRELSLRFPTGLTSSKHIFSQVQRLAAFGLIQTRSSSSIDLETTDPQVTRQRVYSTREEIRINSLGRHYVEHEMKPRDRRLMWNYVDRVQNSNKALLLKLSGAFPPPVVLGHALPRRSLSALATLDRRRDELAKQIHENHGCALRFTCDQPDPGTVRVP